MFRKKADIRLNYKKEINQDNTEEIFWWNNDLITVEKRRFFELVVIYSKYDQHQTCHKIDVENCATCSQF